MLIQSHQEMITCKSSPKWLINYSSKLLYFALLILFMLCTQPALASWSTLNSGTNEDLLTMDFPVDATTGYVAGRRGVLLKTSDGGNTWQRQNAKARSTNSILDMDFIDNQTGYAVGTNGTLLKTTNGGAQWLALNPGTSVHLYSVNFPVDASTGYIGGANNTLLKTTDGGQTWSPQYIDGGYVMTIVFPRNNLVGYASTVYGTLGYVFKTVDGGQNWTRVFYIEDAYLYSMSFVDEQVGYVSNHDTYYQYGIWKTIDGGANWEWVTPGLSIIPRALDFPVNASTGFAVGEKGGMMSTQDGGTSWQEGNLGNNVYLNDVQFVDNQIGYTIGSAGFIGKTTDGGAPTNILAYLHPTSSGTIQEFTHISGCSTDWDCVNDQLGNIATGLPQAMRMDYVADGTGHRHMFALDDHALGNVRISEVCVYMASIQSSGPYASLGYQRVGIDAAPVESVPFWVGNYWIMGYVKSCWSNLDWTSSDLAALQIGVRSVNGQWLEVSQLFARIAYRSLP